MDFYLDKIIEDNIQKINNCENLGEEKNLRELAVVFNEYYGEDRVDFELRSNIRALNIYKERLIRNKNLLYRFMEDCEKIIFSKIEFGIKIFSTSYSDDEEMDFMDCHVLGKIYDIESYSSIMYLLSFYHTFIEKLFLDKTPIAPIENIKQYYFLRHYPTAKIMQIGTQRLYEILFSNKNLIRTIFKLIKNQSNNSRYENNSGKIVNVPDYSIYIKVAKEYRNNENFISDDFYKLFHAYRLNLKTFKIRSSCLYEHFQGNFNKPNPTTAKILVYFPEITIANGHNSMKLLDCYVRFIIDNNRKLIDKEFIRSTVTLPEYVRSYQHSHVSGGCFYFGNFCFGSGPISLTISKLNVSTSRYDIIPIYLYKLFLYEFDKYLEVESLRGGPYKLMDDVLKDSYTQEPVIGLKALHDLETDDLDSITTVMSNSNIMDIIFSNLEIFEYTTKKGIILLNETLISFFLKINVLLKQKHERHFVKDYFLDQTRDSISYVTANLASSMINAKESSGKYLFTFNGKEIKSNVIENITNENNFHKGLKIALYAYIYASILKLINPLKIN